MSLNRTQVRRYAIGGLALLIALIAWFGSTTALVAPIVAESTPPADPTIRRVSTPAPVLEQGPPVRAIAPIGPVSLGPDRLTNQVANFQRLISCHIPDDDSNDKSVDVALIDARGSSMGVDTGYVMDGEFRVIVPEGVAAFTARTADGVPYLLKLVGDRCEAVRLTDVTVAEGRVVDDHGQPVWGALVVGCGSVARTGMDGRFRLGVSHPRPCRVDLRCHGYVPGTAAMIDDLDAVYTMAVVATADSERRQGDVVSAVYDIIEQIDADTVDSDAAMKDAVDDLHASMDAAGDLHTSMAATRDTRFYVHDCAVTRPPGVPAE